MRSRMISGPALVAVVGVLSACASSSSVRSGPAPAGSPAQNAARAAYIAHGDQICRKGKQAIAPIDARAASIERRHSPAWREARLMVPVLRAGLRRYRRVYQRLEAIPPPAGESATVSQILAGLKRVGDDAEHLLSALERGETAAVRRLSATREVDHARVSALELEFGFRVCGQPSARSPVAG